MCGYQKTNPVPTVPVCVCKQGVCFCVQVELALCEFIKLRAATDHYDQYTISICQANCVQHICTNIEGSLKDKWIQGRKRAKCTPLNLSQNLCTCTHICFYAGVVLYNLYPPRSTFSRRLQSRGIKWASDHVWAL